MEHSFSFSDLIGIMQTLRSPQGCPWDREQSFESILDCLQEESSEYIDAVIAKDHENMKEELGDILLQVVFHSQMAKEKGWFTIEDVVNGISKKMIRRHPHVFDKSKITVNSADQVSHLWEQIKQQEKKNNIHQDSNDRFKNIPQSLNSLLTSQKIQKKAAKTGFDWGNYQEPLKKVQEEVLELKEAVENQTNIEEELGDIFFALVNVSKHLKINPDLALSKANKKFIRRFNKMEAFIQKEGRQIEDLSLNQMDGYWDKVKLGEG